MIGLVSALSCVVEWLEIADNAKTQFEYIEIFVE
jgi:hypothetical protein